MFRRNRRRAGRWRWSKTVTKSSWIPTRASWSCGFPMTNSIAGKRRGNLPRTHGPEAISGSTSTTCCRRIRGRIWIFWSGAEARGFLARVTSSDRMTLMSAKVLACSIALAATLAGQNKTCDRACLEPFVDKYLDAMAAHDPAKAPFAKGVESTENGQRLELGDGLWNTMTGKG